MGEHCQAPAASSIISVYGASDDAVVVKGCTGDGEYDTYEYQLVWRGDFTAPSGQTLRVHGLFTDGAWSFATGPADGTAPMPNWPIRTIPHPARTYTALLLIDAPAGTRLENVWPAYE